MRGRRRSLLLALLALAIPLPALALSSGGDSGSPPAPVPLSVSTALDSCGIVESQVICKLGVSFNAVPGATSYAASVTRADGSVVDYGGVGAGGGSLWVPYTGSGTYSVRISAYGSPPEAEPGEAEERGNELITSGAAEATHVGPKAAGNARPDQDPGARDADGEKSSGSNAANDHDPGAEPGAGTSSQSSCAEDPAPPPAPASDEEPWPELPPEDLDPEDADEDDDGVDDDEERAAFELAFNERMAAALAAQAELPDAIACGERVSP
jgi:hypothetical protein